MLPAVQGIGARLRESLVVFRDVFRNEGLRRLQFASIGSMVGGWAYVIAVAVFAYTQDGAYAVGLLGLLRWLSAGIAAPFAGIVGDRFARRRVMLVSDFVRAAAMAAMAVVVFADGPALAVYALAIAAAVAGTAFAPAEAAILPDLARTPEELTAANVASSTIYSAGTFVGPALGGFLLAATSTEVVFAATAALMLWSAAMIAGVSEPVRTDREAEEASGLVGEAVAGVRTIASESRLRVIVGLLTVQTFADGVLDVLIVILALETLALGSSGIGLMNSAAGVGGLVAGLVAAALVARTRLATDFGAGIAAWSLPLVALAIWPNEYVALAVLAVAGGGNTILGVSSDTLLQRAIPAHVLARVFGVLDSLLLVGLAIGAFAAPVLVDAVGMRATLGGLGIALTLIALASWRRLARIDREAEAPLRELELLRSLPVFAPLPPPTLESLAARLVVRRFSAGDTIFRQGDGGNEFYVIGDGRVEVAVDGAPTAELGPGEGFGEIALLRDVPRTATVAAKTHVELYALERDAFIGAVAGHGESASAAEAMAATRLARARPTPV